jgi:predicted transcriptional regulator
MRLNTKTSPSERDRVCRTLGSKGLIGYHEDVKQFSLTPAGRTLLTLDTSVLPVTPDELLVLRTGAKKMGTPGEVPKKVPSDSRQQLIRNLEQRGLVKVQKTQLQEVWLTPAGERYLREDCEPEGGQPVLSLSLLGAYLRLMRQGGKDREQGSLTGHHGL